MSKVKKANVGVSLGDIVDALARLRAEIKRLQDQETELTHALRESGQDKVEGAIATATIVRYVREATDWKSMCEVIGYSAQLKTAHTKRTDCVSVRTAAKLGGGK